MDDLSKDPSSHNFWFKCILSDLSYTVIMFGYNTEGKAERERQRGKGREGKAERGGHRGGGRAERGGHRGRGENMGVKAVWCGVCVGYVIMCTQIYTSSMYPQLQATHVIPIPTICYTHVHTHTHTHTHTNAHAHSLSLSLSHTKTHTVYCTTATQ